MADKYPTYDATVPGGNGYSGSVGSSETRTYTYDVSLNPVWSPDADEIVIRINGTVIRRLSEAAARRLIGVSTR
jgi:hypothetical protein